MICQVIERLKKQNGHVIPFLSHMVWVVFPICEQWILFHLRRMRFQLYRWVMLISLLSHGQDILRITVEDEDNQCVIGELEHLVSDRELTRHTFI